MDSVLRHFVFHIFSQGTKTPIDIIYLKIMINM